MGKFLILGLGLILLTTACSWFKSSEPVSPTPVSVETSPIPRVARKSAPTENTQAAEPAQPLEQNYMIELKMCYSSCEQAPDIRFQQQQAQNFDVNTIDDPKLRDMAEMAKQMGEGFGDLVTKMGESGMQKAACKLKCNTAFLVPATKKVRDCEYELAQEFATVKPLTNKDMENMFEFVFDDPKKITVDTVGKLQFWEEWQTCVKQAAVVSKSAEPCNEITARMPSSDIYAPEMRNECIMEAASRSGEQKLCDSLNYPHGESYNENARRNCRANALQDYR